MDAFFASVEQRDHPELRQKPVAICGHSKRSVVSTASYEARKFGIHSAMPMFMARQMCRNLIIVPPDMKKYTAASRCIMDILADFSPVVEPVSIDEAYLDISGLQRLYGSHEAIGRQIKQKIYDHLQLTCSIGIAPVKFLAKIASDMNKPDGLTLVSPQQIPSFIARLPIHKIPGVGSKAMKQMASLQITTLGDVQKFPLSILTAKFGKMGARLMELSCGIDPSPVDPNHVRKSISSETTLGHDISDPDTIRNVLLDRSQIVGRLLREKKLVCASVFIKLKFSDFSQITRTRKLQTPVCTSAAIYKYALELFETTRITRKIRLAGVGVSALKPKGMPVQMNLIPENPSANTQWESVDSAIDAISEKFGTAIINKANLTRLRKNK